MTCVICRVTCPEALCDDCRAKHPKSCDSCYNLLGAWPDGKVDCRLKGRIHFRPKCDQHLGWIGGTIKHIEIVSESGVIHTIKNVRKPFDFVFQNKRLVRINPWNNS